MSRREGSLKLDDGSVRFHSRGRSGIFRSGPDAVAVDRVSLSVDAGEVVALVGESGCGKSTTGRALVRLVPLHSGRIVLDGEDMTDAKGAALKEYRRRVQIVFQDPYEGLNNRRTVLQTVTEPLEVQGVGANRAERVERAYAALEDVGLTPAKRYAGRRPDELSGGQRQRVAIAAAMTLEPEFLIADEPVSMLDASIGAGIVRLLLELRERRGVGYLFITHDLALARSIADRIAVMYLGRIVEEGAAADVIARPRHPYTQALVAVAPRRNRPPGPRTVLQGEAPDPSRTPPGCRFHPRCPYAFDRCRVEAPPAVTVGPGQIAECWLAVDGDDAQAQQPAAQPGEADRLSQATAKEG